MSDTLQSIISEDVLLSIVLKIIKESKDGISETKLIEKVKECKRIRKSLFYKVLILIQTIITNVGLYIST